MKINMIKVLGTSVTLLSFALSIVSNYVSDKEIETKIKEEVAKALADKTGN